MSVTAKTGLGTTIVFGTSAFSAKIIDIGQIASVSRETIDASNMSTTLWIEKLVADLTDPGELQFDIEYLGSVDPPVTAVAETVTIDIRAQGTGYKVTGSGAITGFTPAVPHNDKMTASITVSWLGAVDFAAS